jgi:hypothetical protein
MACPNRKAICDNTALEMGWGGVSSSRNHICQRLAPLNQFNSAILL